MLSTCIKCNSNLFELKENSPRGANYKIWFIQCSLCDAPVGAMEYFNSGSLIANLEKRVKSIENSIPYIQQSLSNIENYLRAIR